MTDKLSRSESSRCNKTWDNSDRVMNWLSTIARGKNTSKNHVSANPKFRRGKWGAIAEISLRNRVSIEAVGRASRPFRSTVEYESQRVDFGPANLSAACVGNTEDCFSDSHGPRVYSRCHLHRAQPTPQHRAGIVAI